MVMLRLPVVEPFDWPLTLRMIGAHAVPGGERLDPESHTYTRVLNGTFGPLVVTIRAYPGHLSVWLDGGLVPVTDDDTVAVTAQVRHWLDLDLDPMDAITRFAADPMLGPLVHVRPGLRRIRYPASFEAVVTTVLGQQVSLAAARTFAGRLVAAYGPAAPQELNAFPGPERLADAPVAQLQSAVGITGARARTVRAVAELFAATGDWPVPLPEAEWATVPPSCSRCRASAHGRSTTCECACSAIRMRYRSATWCSAERSAWPRIVMSRQRWSPGVPSARTPLSNSGRPRAGECVMGSQSSTAA